MGESALASPNKEAKHSEVSKYLTNVQQPNHSAPPKPLLHSCVCGTIWQSNVRPNGAPPWVKMIVKTLHETNPVPLDINLEIHEQETYAMSCTKSYAKPLYSFIGSLSLTFTHLDRRKRPSLKALSWTFQPTCYPRVRAANIIMQTSVRQIA